MRLEDFYYQGRPEHLITLDKDGYGIAFLRRCFALTKGHIFDDALTNRVKQYQQENKLVVDGIVGPDTFSNIGHEMAGFDKNYCFTHSLWARGRKDG